MTMIMMVIIRILIVIIMMMIMIIRPDLVDPLFHAAAEAISHISLSLRFSYHCYQCYHHHRQQSSHCRIAFVIVVAMSSITLKTPSSLKIHLSSVFVTVIITIERHQVRTPFIIMCTCVR